MQGEVEVSDSLEMISQNENRITITDIVRLYTRESDDPNLLHRVIQRQALPMNCETISNNS
jgi:MOSC domain-containing protein YiiM